MELGLADKTVVVLASTGGLGLAVARALAREGARVAISGRDPGRLRRARAELAGLAGDERVLAEALDVTHGAALEAHLERARQRFGGVHGLVTNAGGPPPALASELDDAGLDAAFELTLRSAVRATRRVLPWMRAQGFGRIVGLTSIAVRQPIPNLAYSNVMRSGLTAYFKSLAGEVAGEGVLVNTVCTGLFATERLEGLFAARAERNGTTVDEERRAALASIPAGRLGSPAEFGDLVAFLCSERCSYLSGVALAYDGGASAALL